MNIFDETRAVEQLMIDWNALRVTEGYRRVSFTRQRDEAMARWVAHGPHGETESHFIDFRTEHGALVLREVIELEERSDATYARCRNEIDALSSLSEKGRHKAIARIHGVCADAIRVDMRYRTALLTTYQHEVKELVDYIDERLEESDN